MPDARDEECDRREIRALIDAWPIWRDGGCWDHLLRAWHAGGTMSSTRFSGTAEEFVAQTRAGYERGAQVRHAQSGFWCRIAGDRAVTVTGMEILQRAEIGGVEVDATCIGRFVDFLAHRQGRWGIVRRQPAYDRDRLDPVGGDALPPLDEALLASFPRPYRHLAYLQHGLGLSINRDLPAASGPSWTALLDEAERWLAGGGMQGQPLRRVVLGEAGVVRDGLPPDSRTPVPGLTTTLMWATARDTDHRTLPDAIPRPAGVAPPDGGSRFSVLDIAPGHRSKALHRTDTVDYVICLDGPIDLLVEAGDVRLERGEIAIQCGAMHGWHNPGPGTARVAVVLLDALPKRDGGVAGGSEAP